MSTTPRSSQSPQTERRVNRSNTAPTTPYSWTLSAVSTWVRTTRSDTVQTLAARNVPGTTSLTGWTTHRIASTGDEQGTERPPDHHGTEDHLHRARDAKCEKGADGDEHRRLDGHRHQHEGTVEVPLERRAQGALVVRVGEDAVDGPNMRWALHSVMASASATARARPSASEPYRSNARRTDPEPAPVTESSACARASRRSPTVPATEAKIPRARRVLKA